MRLISISLKRLVFSITALLCIINWHTSAQTLLAVDTIGGSITFAATNPITNKIYVPNYNNGTISIVNGSTNRIATVTVGKNPYNVAINPVTNKIYVTNSGDSSISIINGSTDSVSGVIKVGTHPLGIAVNPVTDKIYVTNTGSNTISVINDSTNSLTTVAVGHYPLAVAVNCVTNKIYVANDTLNGTVSVIDGNTNLTTTLSVESYPHSIAVNPVTNKIYVANRVSNSVSIIDGITNVVSNVPVGTNPENLVVNMATNKIYVANYASSSISVIDAATNTITAITGITSPNCVTINPITNKIYVANQFGVSIINGFSGTIINTVSFPYTSVKWITINPVTNKLYVETGYTNYNIKVLDEVLNTITTIVSGTNPLAVATNIVTNKTYIANYGTNNVSVIDGATNTASTITAGSNPKGIAVNPVTNKIYVANSGSSNVTIIDGMAGTTTNVAAGIMPAAIAANPVTNNIYVANYNSNTVTIINGAKNITTTVSVGTNPQAIGINPATNKIYVANGASNTVSIIDGSTNTVTSVTVGTTPQSIAVNPVTNQIYIANYNNNTVSVIDGATSTVTATFIVGTNPRSIAVNTLTNTIYVANSGSNNITIINGATNTTKTITAGNQPYAIAVDAVTNKVYISNASGSNVTILFGFSNVTTSVTAGTNPYSIAVNPITGCIYVANYSSNNITVISDTSFRDSKVSVSIDTMGKTVGLLAQPVLTGKAISRLGTHCSRIERVLSCLGTSQKALNIDSLLTGSGTDSVTWNWTWGTDTLQFGENFLISTALETNAATTNSSNGTPYTANTSIFTIYRIAACAMPGIPVIITPVSGTQNIELTPSLTWSTTANTLTYHIQLSTSSTFASTLLDDTSLTTNSKTISTALAYNTTYFWRVNGVNVDTTGIWSAIASFSTLPLSPDPVTLTSPAGGATNVSIIPTLTWNSATTGGTPTIYLIRVSTSTSFSTTVINDSTTSKIYTIHTSLSNSTTYYWEVAAKISNTTSSFTTSGFTTIIAAPGAVTLTAPVSNATREAVMPTLTWTAGSGGAPDKYLVKVSTSSLFGITVIDDSTTDQSFTLNAPLSNNTMYFWEVATKNANSTSSYVMAGFTTIVAAPGAVTLSMPSNNSTTVLVTATLAWAKGTGGQPAQYYVRVSTDSLFGVLVVNDSTVQTSYTITAPLLNSVKYFWEVCAGNANCKSSWTTRCFTTIFPPPDNVVLITPAHGTVGVSLTPKFVWNTSARAVSYHIQVAATSAFSALLLNDSLTGTSDSITTELEYNTKYFWRVNGTNVAGTNAWTVDSFYTLSKYAVALTSGWNIASLNIVPQDSSAATIFGSMNHVVIVKNSDGDVYWPSYNINTIVTVHVVQGYQVYTSAADTIRTAGVPVNVATTPIALNAGWNLIAYLPQIDQLITTVLADISSNITIVKNGAGDVFWPDYGINNIGTMHAGEGYYIHMKAAATLTYPSGLGKTVAVANGLMLPKAKHYVYSNGNTGNNATLLLSNVVEHTAVIPDSSEIGVYDASGTLVGSGVVVNGKTAFSVWGDNVMTKAKDGLSVSEAMTFKVWTPGREEYTGTFVGTNSSGYTDNALMLGTLSIHHTTAITTCALANAYPNPFRGTVRIGFDVAATRGIDVQSVEVNIYDLRGTLVRQLAKGMYKTGHYSVVWDGNDHIGSNMYIVMMKTNNFTQKMKLFKVK